MANENFRIFFLVISVLGFICCLDRADYNVALGVFGFVLWKQTQFPQKHRILWVVIISIFTDALWIFITSLIIWGQEERTGNNIRGLTQAVSIINIVFKILTVLYAVLNIEQCKDLFDCSVFGRKTLYL